MSEISRVSCRVASFSTSKRFFLGFVIPPLAAVARFVKSLFEELGSPELGRGLSDRREWEMLHLYVLLKCNGKFHLLGKLLLLSRENSANFLCVLTVNGVRLVKHIVPCSKARE